MSQKKLFEHEVLCIVTGEYFRLSLKNYLVWYWARMWHFVSWGQVEVHVEVAWLLIFEDDGLVPWIWRNCKFWPNLKKGFCVEYCSRKILVNAGLRCEEHMLVPCQSIVARWRPGNFMILIMVKYRAAEVKVYRKYGSKVVIVKLFCWWVVAE